jgi:hypothetical protein
MGQAYATIESTHFVDAEAKFCKCFYWNVTRAALAWMRTYLCKISSIKCFISIVLRTPNVQATIMPYGVRRTCPPCNLLERPHSVADSQFHESTPGRANQGE